MSEHKSNHYTYTGLRIKAIREKTGLTQKQMARQLDIANATLCAIEKGNAAPSFEVIEKLHRLYNVNLYYLFDGSGAMFADENAARDYLAKIPPDQILFLEDFLHLFINSALVRYSFQAYFQQYKLENHNLIQLDMNTNNTNNTNNTDNTNNTGG